MDLNKNKQLLQAAADDVSRAARVIVGGKEVAKLKNAFFDMQETLKARNDLAARNSKTETAYGRFIEYCSLDVTQEGVEVFANLSHRVDKTGACRNCHKSDTLSLMLSCPAYRPRFNYLTKSIWAAMYGMNLAMPRS